ncbi:hypothetical protein Ais01nite_17530 [Asanoa ishikariensis]|uniref:Predicted ATPase n=1 Tax=Asanoa ishikariensis TaxID=137265 RepID=A0A1H3UEH8_9ACTN|nr:DUF4062 domain-containing protein [Asanoa ishikariensis]GIF63718.1 hypothetical protein Ais01nite_17530 [Asanoa ishikariensis]SDZ60834.1 Predicted ATPase [Asanoa ishikariensis]
MTSDLILTPDQRVRVFVSSTLTELAAERQAVSDAVVGLHLVPVMFESGARPHAPSDVYRSYLAQSQVFVGVYDESYGWIGPDSTISGLAEEYGLARDLPRLIYVKEPAPGRDARLADLLARMDRDAAVSYRSFRSPDELRGHVERDLAALLSLHFDQARRTPRDSDTGAGDGIPVARTPLVGREHELDVLAALLTDERVPLLTLAGPGGVGKTRLAGALAARVAAGYPDGVRYVDLSAVTGGDAAGEAFARALRLRTSGGVAAFADVVSFLRSKRLLLVVDNFEQIVDLAPRLTTLLRAAPGVSVVVTSRVPLRLSVERVFRVPPLRSAPDSARHDLAMITQRFSAVRLFVDRARAADRRFALTDDNAAAVLEITRRLGGIPLAIELAAARVPLLPPAAIAALLDDQLSLLTSGRRDLPERQRTVRDTLAWSHRLLPHDAQRLLARTGVFAGGFDLAAIEAVCVCDEEPMDTFGALESLVDAALVEPDGDDRFRLAESVRDFARERLAEVGEWDVTHDRHAAYFRDLALRAEPHLNTADSPEWLSRIERDHRNLDAALDRLLDTGRPVEAVEVCWGLWLFWWRRGHIDEGVRYLRRVLADPDVLPPAVRGRALVVAAAMAYVSGQDDEARTTFEQARELARAAGDDVAEAHALGPLGTYAARAGDIDRGRELLGQAYELAVRGNRLWLVSLFHCRLGMIAFRSGDAAGAVRHLDEAKRVAAEVDDELGLVVAHYSAAVVRVATGDLAGAHANLVAGLRSASKSGDLACAGWILVALSDVAAARGRLVRSVRLAAAAATFRTPSGKLWMRAYVPPWPTAGADLAELRVRLGDERYERSRREGERLGLAGAVEEAARDDEAGAPEGTPAQVDEPQPRQW